MRLYRAYVSALKDERLGGSRAGGKWMDARIFNA